ncbi:MAG: two-component regulator propeller domain-containing protein [Rikenellaceae bacterium]
MKKLFDAIRFLLICILSNVAYVSLAVPINIPYIDVISNTDGLPSDQIVCLCQDQDGFVWIGTDQGLARYDGYDVKLYNVWLTHSQNNRILAIAIDDDGVLWCATKQAVYCVDTRSERVEWFDLEELQGKCVQHIYTQGDQIWFATDGGVVRYSRSRGRVKVYSSKSGDLSQPDVRYINRAAGGAIYLFYKYRGGAIYDPRLDTFSDLPTMPGRDELTYTSLFADGDRVFFTTWQRGVYEVHHNSSTGEVSYSTSATKRWYDKQTINAVVKDDCYNLYWVCTMSGVYVVDDLIDPTQQFRIKSGYNRDELRNEEVRSVYYSSNEKCLWFGTNGGGVNKLSLESIIINNNLLSNIKQLNSSTVTTIYDNGDELWLGIRSGVMAIYNKRSRAVKSYRTHPVFKKIKNVSNSVEVIKKIVSRNEIWLGTRYNSIYIAKLDSAERIVDFDHLNRVGVRQPALREVSTIFEDSHGNVWVAALKKLLVYANAESDDLLQPREVTSFSPIPTDGADMAVVGIVEGDRGEIYVATREMGVYCAEYSESGEYEFRQVRAINDIITSFCSDSRGRLWIGTQNNALLQLKPESKTIIHNEHLLDRDIASVNSIIEISDNIFWLGTNKGVVNLNTELNEATIYTYLDGLTDNIFINNSVCLDSNNTLFYGGYNGLSNIDFSQYRDNTHTPRTVITDITAADNQSILSDPTAVERNEEGYIEKIYLDHYNKNFTIHFSALSMAAPHSNSYRYKLEGYDNYYLYVGDGKHEVSYSNMDSGTYLFSVMGSNNSGKWSHEPTELWVVIRTPLWATWWALMIYVALVLAVSIFIIYLIVARVRLHNRLKIAGIEESQRVEVNRAKLQFFTNVSHELLTPLSIISCGLEDLDTREEQNQEVYKILRNNTMRLMSLVEQVLEFRKADTGNLKLKVAHDNLTSLINRITQDSFEPLLRGKSIELRVDSTPEQIEGWFDRDKVDKILYNLLSNACKYNYEGGHITVTVEGVLASTLESVQSVNISVRNTGEVISAEQMQSLFKRFYDGAYRKYNVKGVGIGLSLTKSLVDLHRGEIGVESDASRGTCFSFTIPLARSSYNEEEIDSTVETVLDEIDDEVVCTDGAAQRRKILLVEDEADLQRVIALNLSSDYDLYTASNGEEALAQIEEVVPDIVVSDVVMPVMDGFALCQSIKSNFNTSHIPVILLTAKVSNRSRQEGYNSRADAYMTKPIDMALLRSRILNLMANREMVAQRFRNLTLNVAKSNDFSKIDEEFLSRAIKCIEANLERTEFDVKELQESLNMTGSTLYRKLKSLTDLSPNEFIRHIRLKSAYHLLKSKSSSVTVADVAYAVGFTSPNYFARCFKTEFGVSPSQVAAENE